MTVLPVIRFSTMRRATDRSRERSSSMESNSPSVFSFIREYISRNSLMVDEFYDAVKLTHNKTLILRKMNPYVLKFCPEENLFELMFDVKKNIFCQGFIHRGLGGGNAQDYSYYRDNVSLPFRQLIELIWERVTSAVMTIEPNKPKPAEMLDYPLPPYIVNPNPEYFRLIILGMRSAPLMF